MCKEYPLGINDFVETANVNDRLGLLYDSTAQAGNLTNDIHPLFKSSCFLGQSPHIKQALQLASLFLQYDSLLEFFIPLTYGQRRTDVATGKPYLTNPLASESESKIKEYLARVRNALNCLQHCTVYQWTQPHQQRLWARTTFYEDRKPKHNSTCSSLFIYPYSILIELNRKFLTFYQDEKTGYKEAHRCAQFRHDFQFAVTLVHEVVHAYGAMRRGTLNEPSLRCDHPDKPEWGYAWENFMFGAIINPQDRNRVGTHVQLRKTWSDKTQEASADGKEYSAISMSWIAQWFQRKTWAKIEKGGPLTIPPSTVRIKFFMSHTLSRWFVLSDVPSTQRDIEARHDKAVRRYQEDKEKGIQPSSRDIEVARSVWQFVDSNLLQQSNVPIPVRVPPKIVFSEVRKSSKRLSVGTGFYSTSSMSSRGSVSSTTTVVEVIESVSRASSSSRGKRARGDDVVEVERPRKAVKRVTSR